MSSLSLNQLVPTRKQWTNISSKFAIRRFERIFPSISNFQPHWPILQPSISRP